MTYLFKYRIKNNKCYFNKKYLTKVLKVLVKRKISFECEGTVSFKEFNCKYNDYLILGYDKFLFDKYLEEIESKMLKIMGSRNFNRIYQDIIKVVNNSVGR